MTTSRTVETTDDTDTYHIVCHDCATEFLTAGKAEAERQLTEHHSATGHNVEFASVGRVGVEHE